MFYQVMEGEGKAPAMLWLAVSNKLDCLKTRLLIRRILKLLFTWFVVVWMFSRCKYTECPQQQKAQICLAVERRKLDSSSNITANILKQTVCTCYIVLSNWDSKVTESYFTIQRILLDRLLEMCDIGTTELLVIL